MASIPRTYVLDTNVLIHDPAALFRFAEHNVLVPMTVLEELDAIKKGASEVARNARQASRMLDATLGSADADAIAAGLPLAAAGGDMRPGGRLFLQTRPPGGDDMPVFGGHNPDNTILKTLLTLSRGDGQGDVILVSKDINLRIKARVLGIAAEDYVNDKILDDIDLLHTGITDLDATAWASLKAAAEPWQDGSLRGYRLAAAALPQAVCNSFVGVISEDESDAAGFIVTGRDQDTVTLRAVTDYRHGEQEVWGIRARNREQNYALNLLLEPAIEFVSLLGAAGTGKTLLTLAAGLSQCLDQRRYKEIIVTRVTIPVGEDIGFLPGTEEEKMTPWMGALADNLEVLAESEEGGEWGRRATGDLLQQRIKIRSLNFMRGRTFLQRFVIIDEAQNLTPKQMKTLITRAGPGSKFVCLGNLAQIDSPYLSETSSGLTHVVERFRGWPLSGHVHLQRGERSALADYASSHL